MENSAFWLGSKTGALTLVISGFLLTFLGVESIVFTIADRKSVMSSGSFFIFAQQYFCCCCTGPEARKTAQAAARVCVCAETQTHIHIVESESERVSDGSAVVRARGPRTDHGGT